MGLFATFAVVGAALAYATGKGAQILLPTLGWLLTLIGIIGFGRSITRAIVLAFAGPRYLWIAEISSLLMALVLLHGVTTVLVGLGLPTIISGGLLVMMTLSWVLLAAVCLRGNRDGSSRQTRDSRSDV